MFYFFPLVLLLFTFQDDLEHDRKNVLPFSIFSQLNKLPAAVTTAQLWWDWSWDMAFQVGKTWTVYMFVLLPG